MNATARPTTAGARAQGTALSARILPALWAAFWLLMISASLQDAMRNPRIRWWEPVLWEGSSALVATGWMLLAVKVRARYAIYLDRPLAWFGHYLRWLPLAAVTFVTAVYAIRHGVYALAGRPYEHAGWAFIFVYETVKLILFTGLWLGILFGVDTHGQWQQQRNRLLQTQRALAEAQLAHLQGQLRPHFLFNALNTVSALMHTDVERADRLVARLSDLLRISLRSGGSEMIPLAEELRTLALYTDVMRERFRDRVTLEWHADPELDAAPVPALLLQPLVENVFKHAVERTLMPVHVVISTQREGDLLVLTVRNTGSSLPPSFDEGVGLRNGRERLGIIYGGAASMVIRNEADGVTAIVTLPRDRAA